MIVKERTASWFRQVRDGAHRSPAGDDRWRFPARTSCRVDRTDSRWWLTFLCISLVFARSVAAQTPAPAPSSETASEVPASSAPESNQPAAPETRSSPSWPRVPVRSSLDRPRASGQATGDRPASDSAKNTAASAIAPIPYRIIAAPLEQIERMARGEYRTVPQADFRQQLASQTNLLPSPLRRGAMLAEATYAARLESNRLLAGTANWQIVATGDKQAWLDMGQPTLALAEPRWVDANEGAIAVDIGCAPNGNWLLRVPRSGAIQSRWSLAAAERMEERDEDGLEFSIRLPSCPRNRLELQIPAEYVLQVQPGVARRIVLPEDPAAAASGSQLAPSIELWQVDLGGRSECRVLLRRRETFVPQPGLRQNTTYQVSEAGLEVASEVTLDCHNAPLTRASLRLDPPLRLVRATLNGRPLEWTSRGNANGRIEGATNTGGEQEAGERYTLRFPFELTGRQHQVRILALAPPRNEPRWVLPRVHVEGIDWQQETAEVTLASPWVLDELELQRAVQVRDLAWTTDIAADGAEDAAQSAPSVRRRIRFLAPSARVAIQMATPAPRLEVVSATEVQVDRGELRARLVVELRHQGSEQFDLTAALGERWSIESLEAEDPSSINHWQVVTGSTSRQLQVRFRDPIPRDAWLRLTVIARGSHQLDGQPIPLRELTPVEWPVPVEESRQFLVLRASPTVGIDFLNDATMQWLRPDDLDARETRLASARGGERMILLDGRSRRQTVRFFERSEEVRIASSRCRVTTRFSGRTLSENWRIEIDRGPQHPRQLHVQLSQRREGDIRWYLEDAASRDLVARRNETTADDSTETWEIDWPDTAVQSAARSAGQPLVLVGQRVSESSGTTSLALARLQEADAQDGSLELEAANDINLDVDHSPLITALPVGQPSPRETGTRRYSFRYSPLAEIFAPQNAVRVRTAPRDATVLVWNLLVETFVDTGSVMPGQVTAWLENQGAASFRLRLPEGCRLRDVLLDNRPASYGTDEQGYLLVTLPASARFPQVCIRYDSRGIAREGSVPGLATRLQVQWPDVPSAVLHRRWQVWNAPDLLVPLDGAAIHSARRESTSILAARDATPFARLLGPLYQPHWPRWLDAVAPNAIGSSDTRGDASFRASHRPTAVPLVAFDNANDAGRDENTRNENTGNDAVGNESDESRDEQVSVTGSPQAAARYWLDRLGDERVQTWQDLRDLSRRSTASPVPSTPLWLDATHLTARGITPASQLPAASASSAAQRGLQRLRAMQLVLLMTRAGTVVTTSAAVASLPSAPDRIADGPLVPWQSEGLEVRGSEATLASAPWLPLVALDAWSRVAATWTAFREDLMPYEASGWEWVEQPAGREQVWVWRRSGLRAWTLAAWIAGLGVVRLLARQRHGGPLAGIGLFVAGLLALFLPAPLYGLAQGVLLGGWLAIAGLACRVRWPGRSDRRWSATDHASAPRASSAAVTALVALVCLAGVLTLAAPLSAQSPAAINPSIDASSIDDPSVENSSVDNPAWAEAASPGEVPDGRESTSGRNRNAGQATAARRPWDVFVPVDDQGNAAGDYLLVPAELQRQLLRVNSANLGSPAWLLASARYSGTLQQRDPLSPLELDRLTARFELEVFQGNQPLRFPIAEGAANVLERQARLDGRVVELNWNAQDASVSLPRLAAGRHDLEVTFRCQSEREGERTTVRLPIPRAPQATLSLDSPIELRDLAVPSARGTRTRRETTGQLQAELGASDQLWIEWQLPREASSVPSLELLTWLRLAPESVELDAVCLVDARRYAESTLMLEVDDRLQLDLERSAAPLSTMPGSAEGLRRMEFAVPEPASGTRVPRDLVRIPLRFNWPEYAGIGRVPAPTLRLVAPQALYWLGVSADDRLTVRIEPGNGQSLATTDFRQAWGAGPPPDYAYQFASTPRGWVSQGQPGIAPPALELQTAFVAGATSTRTLVAATLRPPATGTFQQRVQVPEDMEILSVQKVAGPATTSIRWARPAPNLLTIFFEPVVTGTCQFGIVAQQAGQSLGARQLPELRWLDATVASDRRAIYRNHDVLLPATPERAPDTDQPLASELGPFLRNQLGLARPWERWQSAESVAGREIDVQANARQLHADLLQIVSRRQGAWHLQVELRLRLDAGVLDDLTLEIPDSWTFALQQDADSRILLAPSPRPGMARVTIWPQARPLDTRVPFVLGGPIPVRPGEPMRVPHVRLLEDAETTERLYLPAESDGRPVLWSLTGLQPLEEPVPAAVDADRSSVYRGFRVESRDFQAVRLPAPGSQGQPRVRLSDLRVACLPVESKLPASGHSTVPYEVCGLLDLQPEGLAAVWLELPEGVELLLATMDDQMLTIPRLKKIQQAGVQQWQLPVTGALLPVQLRVVYRGSTASRVAGRDATFAMPRLRISPATSADIPVARTLWTLHDLADRNPAGRRGHWTGPAALTTSDFQQRQWRLAELADAFRQATQQSTEFSPVDLSRWYSTWGARFLAQVAAARAAGRSPATGQAPPDEQTARAASQLTELVAEHIERVTQLKVEADYQRLEAEGNVASTDRIWDDGLPRQTAVWHGTTTDSIPELRLAWNPDTPRSGPLFTALLLLVGSSLWISWRWPR